LRSRRHGFLVAERSRFSRYGPLLIANLTQSKEWCDGRATGRILQMTQSEFLFSSSQSRLVIQRCLVKRTRFRNVVSGARVDNPFRSVRFPGWPFDQQPLLGTRFTAPYELLVASSLPYSAADKPIVSHSVSLHSASCKKFVARGNWHSFFRPREASKFTLVS
jgi:hypothetical protein